MIEKKRWNVERGFHPLVLIPFGITLTFALLMFITPCLLPQDSVTDLSGSVGRIDNANQTSRMDSLSRCIYEGGDVNCHQKASRSLFFNGNEMPYCARCTGIFVGLAMGTAITVVLIFDLKLWLIIGGLIPMGIDGVGQTVGLWESTNAMRLFTGGLAGAVTGLALGFIFFVAEDAIRDWRAKRSLARAGIQKSAAAGTENAKDGVGREDGAKDAKSERLENVDGAKHARKDANDDGALDGAPDKGGPDS